MKDFILKIIKTAYDPAHVDSFLAGFKSHIAPDRSLKGDELSIRTRVLERELKIGNTYLLDRYIRSFNKRSRTVLQVRETFLIVLGNGESRVVISVQCR